MLSTTLQFFQQRLGFFQVHRVKPFGEPAIDLRQHPAGFFLLALSLPQPAQAHHRPQFPRLRLLSAGNLDSFVKTRFGFSLGVGDQGSGVGNLELGT